MFLDCGWETITCHSHLPLKKPSVPKLLERIRHLAALLPIYERVAAAARSLGADVRVEARQTYMTFTRGKQFALVQPTTIKRVDVGIIGPHLQSTERLQPAGAFGSGRVTHRVGLTAPEEVDGELLGWLRAAYDWAAG